MLKSNVNSKELGNSQQIRMNREEINDYIDTIIRNAKKLVSLTNDILDITRIETNSLTLRKEAVNLRLFLLELVMEYESQHTSKMETMDLHTTTNCNRYKTRIDYSQLNNSRIDDSLLVELDKSRISQVIYNLLDNAFKFTKDGDVIHIISDVEFINDQKFVVISVRDSGKGINMEILPKLFTKFTTMSEKGIGLGLYITKNIIEAHSGRIWAKNNANGIGATFSFTLPCEP
jgi:signal transduction histidine kinase